MMIEMTTYIHHFVIAIATTPTEHLKMTGETPEIRSNKRKLREKREKKQEKTRKKREKMREKRKKKKKKREKG